MNSAHHIQLCNIDEIPPDSARGFSVSVTGGMHGVFVVNKNDQYFGFVNSCPHTGAPLEWMPDQFLSLDGEHIQCSLHGARFTIDRGLCIYGPCLGQSLQPIELDIANGMIHWLHQGEENP